MAGSPLPLPPPPHSHGVESLDKAILVLLSWVTAEPGQRLDKGCLFKAQPPPQPAVQARPEVMECKELSGGLLTLTGPAWHRVTAVAGDAGWGADEAMLSALLSGAGEG